MGGLLTASSGRLSRRGVLASALLELALVAGAIVCAVRAVQVHDDSKNVFIGFSCIVRIGEATCPAPDLPDPYWWEVAAGALATVAAGLLLAGLLRVRAPRLLTRSGVLLTGGLLGFTCLAVSSRWLMTNDSRPAWAAASLLIGVGLLVVVETVWLLGELRAGRLALSRP